MRDALAVRLHVQHYDGLFDCHCRREPLTRYPCAVDDLIREYAFDEGRGAKSVLRLEVRVRVDDRAPAPWILNILDAYGDFPPNSLMSVFINKFLSPLEIMVHTCSIVNGCMTSLP